MRRVEDPSTIHSYLIEARNVRQRRIGGETRPEDYEAKYQALQEEADRIEALPCEEWVEYQVLNLKQMIVDFLPIEDLKMRADSVMLELEEYSEDSSYRYDREYYGKWKERHDGAVNRIEDAKQIKNEEREEDRTLREDNSAERMRALLRSLYDHVADYSMNWASGSTIIRGLNIGGIATVLAFLLGALVPVLHPNTDSYLNVLHWALLGVVGAITAALLSLHRSDLVEVGNTEGRKELWRAVLSGVLGLVAGVLAYGLIAGGLLGGEGAAVPSVYCDVTVWYCNEESNPHGPQQSDFALTLIWAIGAGFSFERVFERVRGVADVGS